MNNVTPILTNSRTLTLVDQDGKVVFQAGLPANMRKPGVVILEGHTFAWERKWTYRLCDHISLEQTHAQSLKSKLLLPH